MSMHFPALSVDGQDDLYIIWELFPRRGSASQGLGFTVSSDAGRTFAPPSVVPGSLDPALGTVNPRPCEALPRLGKSSQMMYRSSSPSTLRAGKCMLANCSAWGLALSLGASQESPLSCERVYCMP